MGDEGALLALFQSLGQPQRGAQRAGLSGAQVSPAGKLYICKDTAGRPAFLLPGNVSLPPVRLENLEVRHRVRCTVVANSRSIEIESATLISCLSHEVNLQAYFVQALGAVLRAHALRGNTAQLGAMIEGLSELFQAVTAEPASTAQGLWAELTLIDLSMSPAVFVGAWHSEVDDLYDFSLGTERIEVKSSIDKTRCHHFRLEQVEDVPCMQVVVASILVDRAARGLSLGDLWDRCRRHVESNPSLQVKVDAICFRSLGKHWCRWRELSYDYNRAIASLAFFDARSVPKPVTPVPPGVSEIKFVADLSLIERIDPVALHHRGQLFGGFEFGGVTIIGEEASQGRAQAAFSRNT